VLDFFGGRRDLRDGKIRVLHGLSFIEDPTRALRAVRFASLLGFELSRETAHLVKVAARERVFDRLSPVRLRREMEQLLGGRHPANAVRTLVAHGLLAFLHPALRPTRRAYARLERAEEVLSWYRLLYREESVAGWTIVLGVLSENLPPRSRTEMVERLRPGRAARRILLEAPDGVHRILAGLASRRAMSSRSTVFAVCRTEPVEVVLLAMVLTGREEVRRQLSEYLAKLRDVRPDITGRDLIRAGVAAGPAVARGLDAALAAKLDGGAAGRDAQLRAALAAVEEA
jgi:tRNA nucleotidyltransferase (CCA-adding enzyme)